MPSRHLMRAVLQAVDEAPEDEAGDSADGDNTQALRTAAIFIILAAGLLGGIPPLFLNLFRDQTSTATRLVRSLAAGVILALALVHIIPEAVQEMAGLGGIDYPLGGVCVLFGVALMVFLEHLAHTMHSHHAPESAAGQRTSAAAVVRADDGDRESVKADAVPVPDDSHVRASPADEGAGHQHACVSHGSATNWATLAAPEAEGSLRLRVLAYMFELGCVFHSFIIGLSLGVNRTDLAEVRALLIALSFHQWLEGISLASVVIRGGFSHLKGVLMVVIYSLTCPVGIAVGMGIARTYDEESERTRGVQGAFNGVSGGMLLYISLVQLVAEDMSVYVASRKNQTATRMASFLALFAGAASMCLLAVWA